MHAHPIRIDNNRFLPTPISKPKPSILGGWSFSLWVVQHLDFLRQQPARLRYKSLVASAKEAVRQPLRRRKGLRAEVEHRKWMKIWKFFRWIGVRFSTSSRGFWNPRTAPMRCPWGASEGSCRIGKSFSHFFGYLFQIFQRKRFWFSFFLTCYIYITVFFPDL